MEIVKPYIIQMVHTGERWKHIKITNCKELKMHWKTMKSFSSKSKITYFFLHRPAAKWTRKKNKKGRAVSKKRNKTYNCKPIDKTKKESKKQYLILNRSGALWDFPKTSNGDRFPGKDYTNKKFIRQSNKNNKEQHIFKKKFTMKAAIFSILKE